jgi:hypothetical protein
MFWLVIVTRYNGTPTAMIVGRSNAGATASRAGAACVQSARPNAPVVASAPSAAASAPGTAHRGATRTKTAQVNSTAPMANGLVGNSWNGVTHSDTSTPASIALAMLPGIARTRRASAGTRPVSASSPPHTMNAPTAAAKPWDGVGAEASRAAPGWTRRP